MKEVKILHATSLEFMKSHIDFHTITWKPPSLSMEERERSSAPRKDKTLAVSRNVDHVALLDVSVQNLHR